MANNTIGWGQGATNNNIGWGRGSTNDIGWGGIYTSTWTDETDIIGNLSVVSFVARVASDGGYIEKINCLIGAINGLPDTPTAEEIFEGFNVRVVSDSGYTEAKLCTIHFIKDLI